MHVFLGYKKLPQIFITQYNSTLPNIDNYYQLSSTLYSKQRQLLPTQLNSAHQRHPERLKK